MLVPEVAMSGHLRMIFSAWVMLTLALNSLRSNFFHTEFPSKFLIIVTLKGGQGSGGSHHHAESPGLLCLRGFCDSGNSSVCQVLRTQGAAPILMRQAPPAPVSFFSPSAQLFGPRAL